eukprot:TRINITY_DN12980_c0_g1_i3.p1 TRINITY_DN12980_c0_g1~~TRINITY_DN12980_c0_g1_i3.p1  ORF type:complete len:270 (+),score=50.88 TRINITY_DN12980_c0_g1_i3:391-1200(+)
MTQGYTILKTPVLSKHEMNEAVEIARRLWEVQKKSANGEFMMLRPGVSADKRKLLALVYKYSSFLNCLVHGGVQLPGYNMAPYAHHNQVQLAFKEPGDEGYAKLEGMQNSIVGHIDQSDGAKHPPGRPLTNYTALFGIVLSSEAERRSDAGNLWLAPGTHQKFAERFRARKHVKWYPQIVKHYFKKSEYPRMKAVRAAPGQAILMHNSTVHGVGPNNSQTDRIHLYWRLTSAARPDGCKRSYPAAAYDPFLETPLLKTLAERQKKRKTK